MARKVSSALDGDVRNKIIAILGLTFKPNTDDMREAPSIALIAALQDLGAKIRGHDPVGNDQAKLVLTDVIYFDDAYACARGADAIIILTEWEQFRALDLERLRSSMARPIIVDLRNVYSQDVMARHGFSYHSIGRASILAAPKVDHGAASNSTFYLLQAD